MRGLSQHAVGSAVSLQRGITGNARSAMTRMTAHGRIALRPSETYPVDDELGSGARVSQAVLGFGLALEYVQ